MTTFSPLCATYLKELCFSRCLKSLWPILVPGEPFLQSKHRLGFEENPVDRGTACGSSLRLDSQVGSIKWSGVSRLASESFGVGCGRWFLKHLMCTGQLLELSLLPEKLLDGIVIHATYALIQL